MFLAVDSSDCCVMLKKRENSVAVENLHEMNNVTESIKQLAISVDGHPGKVLQLATPSPEKLLFTVLSDARDGFNQKYTIIRQIGKGAFSVVYQCQSKINHDYFAVKVNVFAYHYSLVIFVNSLTNGCFRLWI